MPKELTKEQINQLDREIHEASRAQKAYDLFFKKFIKEKRKTLFLAFNELPLTEEDKLIDVKRMLYAIDTLDQEIQSIINTGQMASITLDEYEGNVNG